MYKACFCILNKEFSDSMNFRYSKIKLKHNHRKTVQIHSMGETGGLGKECLKAVFPLGLL